MQQYAEVYYSTCAQLNQKRHCRQAYLNFERKVQPKKLDLKLKSSILAVIVVDS